MGHLLRGERRGGCAISRGCAENALEAISGRSESWGCYLACDGGTSCDPPRLRRSVVVEQLRGVSRLSAWSAHLRPPRRRDDRPHMVSSRQALPENPDVALAHHGQEAS